MLCLRQRSSPSFNLRFPGCDVSEGRFVRQFALTQGRAKSIGEDLAIETLVRARAMPPEQLERLQPEQASIMRLCVQPISIAEISAYMKVHLGIARVLVSDMAAHDYVAVTTNPVGRDGPDLVTLERLLNDLQTL